MSSVAFRRGLLAAALVLGAGVRAFEAGAQPAAPSPPAPVLLSNAQYDVVVVTAPAVGALDDAGLVDRFLGSCGRRQRIAEGDSLAVARARPWDWSDAAAADDRVTLLVSRSQAAELECQAPSHARLAALGRAIRVTSDSGPRAGRRIREVTVRRGDRRLATLEAVHLQSALLTSRGMHVADDEVMRIVLPVAELAPTPSGHLEDLFLDIRGEDTVFVHSMRLRWDGLRRAWVQLLPARAAAHGGAVTTAVQRLATDASTTEALVTAWVDVGAAFAEAGDVDASRVAFLHAVELEPCLTLAAGTGASAQATLAAIRRPPDRCTASLPRTALRATLLPGFGHWEGSRRRLVGAATFVTVVGALVVSQQANAEARDLYEDYLVASGSTPGDAATAAQRAYRAAESRRVTGSRLVAAGATVWGASVIEALWREKRHAARLQRARDLRPNERSVGVAPIVSIRHVGLRVSW